jgi:RHS repeat-associated protein
MRGFRRIHFKKVFSALFFILIALFSTQYLYAQEGTWCAQGLTPPDPGPPDQPPPCCDCLQAAGMTLPPQCTGSPAYPYSGNYATSSLDLQVPTRGFPLALYRNYDSVRMIDGPFGISWTSSFTGRLREAVYLFAAPSTYFKEVTIIMPNGRPYKFRENSDGSYTPNPINRYTLVKNGDGSFDLTLPQSRSKFHYASNGQLTTETDDYGNTLALTYDGSSRLYRVTDGTGSGRYLEFTFGADGRVSSVRDSSNRTVSYGYNGSGAMTSYTVFPLNAVPKTTTYGYVNGRFAPLLNQIIDHWNRVITTITYDTLDRTATYTEAGETYTYSYAFQGNPNRVVKYASGQSYGWDFIFNSSGLITARSAPMYGGAYVYTTYNADGSVQNSTDEVGVKTSYTYNANGTVATITRDDLGPLATRFDYAYDATFPEKVISITPKNPSSGAVDPNWQAWQYDYYGTGSTAPGALYHVKRVQSDGSTLDTIATYTYNAAGQVLTVTDGSGSVTTYSYDGTSGDLSSVTYPKNSDAGANPVYQYGRDSVGRVTSVTDPLGKITSYTYDNLDRILTVTLPKPSSGSPLNFVTTYTYDNFDSPTGLVFTNQTDPNSKLTKQGYDAYGQMVRSIDALNKTTIFTYTNGLLTSITDANNNVTSYSYDVTRRLITTTFPSGATETYTYWLDNLLNTKTDRKSQTITYAYDHFKRLVTKTYPNSTSISYSYSGQNLNSVTDNFAAETHSFTYDPSYRVISNTQGTRGTITYTYGASDRIATYSVNGGPSATYAYYDDGSLKNIQWSPIVGQFAYQYSLTGQYSTITFPNGQSRNYTYDDQGRLLQLANTISSTDLGTFSYGYDSPLLGQRTSMTSGLGATSYSYDSNYQLTGTTYPNVAPFNGEVHAWTYDNIGNRLTNTVNASTANYTYFKNGSNPLNGQRLQSDGVKTYAYDANGNVTGDGTYTFTWDYENRLIGITGGGVMASYSYDYLGRRKSKTVDSATTQYLYDGEDLVRETSTTVIDYVLGPRIDEPLANSQSSTFSYYNSDGLGSIVSVNNQAAVTQNSYSYDAWGVVRSQTGSVLNSFGYTSREFGEAGMYFYRARYLFPAIGRFNSEDSLRFAAEPNFYPYVLNSPVNRFDPSGLDAITSDPDVLACFRKFWIDARLGTTCEEAWGWLVVEPSTITCGVCPEKKTYQFSKVTFRREDVPPNTKCQVHTHPTRGGRTCPRRGPAPSDDDKTTAGRIKREILGGRDLCIYTVTSVGIYKYDTATGHTTQEAGSEWLKNAGPTCNEGVTCPKK